MAYNKKTWKDGDVITAEDLNNLEEGIAEAKEAAENSGTLTEESDPTVPAWAKQPNKPTYTAAEVGAIPAYTYGTEDLTDGVSPLEPGTMYFVH